MEYELVKVKKSDFTRINEVASILNACGKDMAQKYNLHHWDNSYAKSLLIVGKCALKNDVYIVYDGKEPAATFMTKKHGDSFHFEKLGTLPEKSGCGIGSWCMGEIEEMAKKMACNKVTMEVYEPSKHAISFYQNKGYMVVGKLDTIKYTEVKMEKEI